jgi:hypothetical protein
MSRPEGRLIDPRAGVRSVAIGRRRRLAAVDVAHPVERLGFRARSTKYRTMPISIQMPTIGAVYCSAFAYGGSSMSRIGIVTPPIDRQPGRDHRDHAEHRHEQCLR